MKTEVKVLIGFLLLGLLIASISIFFANSTNERLVKIRLSHGEHLRMVQSLKSKTMEAIQESFAYVLSGDEIEKREYLDWQNNFAFNLKAHIDFVALHNMKAEGEKELTDKIISLQKRLSGNANKMFNEYEEKGSVSTETFHKYESNIDELDANFHLLIRNALFMVLQAKTFINDEIQSDKIKIYTLGTLTLVFCLVFGYFLYFQVKRENRLREENADQLDIIVNNTTSVIYMKNIEGRYLLINKRYEDLFNVKNEEVVGKTDLDLFPKEIAGNFIKNDRNVMDSGIPFEGEEVAPHKDGLHTYISIKVPMRNSAGAIYGICGISTDITDRKKAESELETFASIASHDLQAPLRKISLFGDRLKESAKNLDERSREYILRMQNSAKQMSLFIEDMLNFSVISEEQLPFEKIDLKERLNEICEELSHLILSAEGKINYTNLPEIEGNKIQIDQLFINLITNSLKYKQEDKAPIIKIFQRSNENGFCEILIEDNGIGFDEKYVDKIFEPFQRLHNRTEYKGTGLGLTICKKIVDRHNGTLSVKSSPKKGTIFIIKFPLKQTRIN
jgi:PAS domain S-box-containing protein